MYFNIWRPLVAATKVGGYPSLADVATRSSRGGHRPPADIALKKPMATEVVGAVIGRPLITKHQS